MTEKFDNPQSIVDAHISLKDASLRRWVGGAVLLFCLVGFAAVFYQEYVTHESSSEYPAAKAWWTYTGTAFGYVLRMVFEK